MYSLLPLTSPTYLPTFYVITRLYIYSLTPAAAAPRAPERCRCSATRTADQSTARIAAEQELDERRSAAAAEFPQCPYVVIAPTRVPTDKLAAACRPGWC